ncbi:MAG: AAA family ATPase [Candidatus Moranbacteria bacterium]|nr:AAA family ATPase [Candidatus Moranbacteria bacterium]MDD3965377.1 AAA family ATPase [Candidatus Moranbacteria bacterium]
MQKIILGISGEIASGKDTVGKYMVEKYQASSLRFSQPLRDMLDRLYLEQNRENMAKLSLHLRKAFGEDIFSRVILAEAEKSENKLVVVDGIRRSPDIIHLENEEHFYFVYVETSPEARYKRLIQRHQNTDDTIKTEAQFEKDALLESETQIRALKERADFVINNDGTLEELYAQVDEMVKKLEM